MTRKSKSRFQHYDLFPFLVYNRTLSQKESIPEQFGGSSITYLVPKNVPITRRNNGGENIYLFFSVRKGQRPAPQSPFPGLRIKFRSTNLSTFVKENTLLDVTGDSCDNGNNYLELVWNSRLDRKLSVYIVLGKLMSSKVLLSMFLRSTMHCGKKGFDKLLSSRGSNELVSSKEVVSLQCPLSKQRMGNPVRSTNCKHIQCFDALSYFSINETKPSWICPICNKSAKYKDLVLDNWTVTILSLAPKDCSTVSVDGAGCWSPIVNESSSKRRAKNVVVIDLTGDDDDNDDNDDKVDKENSIQPNKRTRFEPPANNAVNRCNGNQLEQMNLSRGIPNPYTPLAMTTRSRSKRALLDRPQDPVVHNQRQEYNHQGWQSHATEYQPPYNPPRNGYPFINFLNSMNLSSYNQRWDFTYLWNQNRR